METVITRCCCTWVVIANPRKYPPTDGFVDVSKAVCSRTSLLDFDLLSLSFMTINIVNLCINLSVYKPFCGDFRGQMRANMKEKWCQFFCMQDGGLPYLSALMNWLSCLITRRITHILNIQSTKPDKVDLGKSVLQFFNWCINQIGDIVFA